MSSHILVEEWLDPDTLSRMRLLFQNDATSSMGLAIQRRHEGMLGEDVWRLVETTSLTSPFGQLLMKAHPELEKRWREENTSQGPVGACGAGRTSTPNT